MFITKARRFHEDADGRYVAYDYYRLTKARLTPDGKKRNDFPLCLGPLDGLTKRERDELAAETSPDARKIVVMDAGFYSSENVDWLVRNHFDYITVLPSGYARFFAKQSGVAERTPDSDKVVRHQDQRHQEIRLQMGKVETGNTVPSGRSTKSRSSTRERARRRRPSPWSGRSRRRPSKRGRNSTGNTYC